MEAIAFSDNFFFHINIGIKDSIKTIKISDRRIVEKYVTGKC